MVASASPLPGSWQALEALRAEHPTPQLVRREWVSLDGDWEFAFDDAHEGRARGWSGGSSLPHRIRVPFPFEAPLSGIGRGTEVHERVWYRREVEIPASWREGGVLLHFGAVDWQAEVWVNGQPAGIHEGGYTGFVFNIQRLLVAGSAQEIVVAAYDPTDPAAGGWQPKGKQRGSGNIWYTRCTGIWQPVWLEPVSAMYLNNVRVTAEAESGDITATHDGGGNLRVNVSLYGQDVATATGTGPVTARVPEPQLWRPQTPVLYDVSVGLLEGVNAIDEVMAYVGFRTVATRDGMVTVNGEPTFLRGVLDQGYWPDGIYTPPTAEALVDDLRAVQALGFNLARKHVKVEDPRWYYWADRLGVLVTQDMPSSEELRTPEARAAFERELRDMVCALQTHPSILMWVVMNEDWGQPAQQFQSDMVDVVRHLDPTRLVIDASGWTQGDNTDLRDVHNYKDDLTRHVPAAPTHPPTWIGEYGGVSLAVSGHAWGGDDTPWGYWTAEAPDLLIERYRLLTDQLQRPGRLAGYVYTQLTDVESEINGLLTYHRTPKLPYGVIAAINAGGDA